ncbi:L,D-transpeptidase family protein [Streptomyces sp. NPDC050856]|uniref:L,D-transpeptidase family protein n=1 Tax=Streptomyces sp. NPDC050856 TaxID=3154939 RepID=UPI0033FEE1C8
MPVANSARRFALLPAVCAGLILAGCAEPGSAPAPRGAPAADRAAPAASGAPATPASGPTGARSPVARVARIPGLGPAFQARIPATTGQAFVVTGEARNSSIATAVLYERDPVTGWRAVKGPWPAHNALRGWTPDHRAGDLRTPIGVYRLGDAGGRLPDPGTRLPYDQSEEFNMPGTGFLGEPLEGSFDHVLAIDYNRVPGTTPLNKTRPQGTAKGGGVWIHVDHGGPTRACVALSEERLRELLVALDPAKKPVIVMGDVGALAR